MSIYSLPDIAVSISNNMSETLSYLFIYLSNNYCLLCARFSTRLWKYNWKQCRDGLYTAVAFMALYVKRDRQVNRQLKESILNVVKENHCKVLRVLQKRVDQYIFVCKWLNPQLNWFKPNRKFMSSCNYRVKGKTDFICSCIQGSANIRTWALFISLLCFPLCWLKSQDPYG